MSSKRLIKIFNDDRKVQALKREEKILNREKAIKKYLSELLRCEEEVEAILFCKPNSTSTPLDAKHWFRDQKQMLRSTFRTLLNDRRADLSDATPYLLKIDREDPVFASLTNLSKYYLKEWLKRANFITLEIYLHSFNMLPLSQKIRIFLFGGRKHRVI